MKVPPDNIMFAALQVMYVCSYTTRNWTLGEEISRQQISDLWDALHNIPLLLTNWRPDSEEKLLMYLRGYNELWSTPQLLVIYEQHRDELFYEQN